MVAVGLVRLLSNAADPENGGTRLRTVRLFICCAL